MISIAVGAFACISFASASFLEPSSLTQRGGFQTVRNQPYGRSTITLQATPDSVEAILAERYPSFLSNLSANEDAWKAMQSAQGGGTFFAPNEAAFVKLGEKKCEQLADPRNLETTKKILAYHVIGERVTSTELFNAGGVVTMGGEVPVGRSTSGGIFGVGGKEDGGSTIGGATVVESFEIGATCIHEVDDLISPQLLWRFMDQLRIPGSS